MALEGDGGLVLSALLVIVIVSLLIYIFFHHPKQFINLPLEAVGGEAQDIHVVNQDNLLETEEKETTNQYVELLKEMEIQMLAINQLIDDAEDKDTTNPVPRLKQWLDNLKEVVYDAEDVRDVIATQSHENHEVSTTTPWNPFKRPLHQELEDVLCRMKRLIKQKKVFGLRPSTRSETLSRPTSSLVDQSGVYGRADDEEKIKQLLLSDNDGSNVSVIAIVGMGGLGKTTLAQLLFNNYQIDSVFQSNKVWICVEKDFDVIKITKTILEKLTNQSYATNDLDELQMKLRETICGKKFLMVLDDVWNENSTNWDDLRKPFGLATQGSKIIVTTRTKRVASIMGATSTYKLDPLSDEACWQLFSKHAFENIQSNDYSIFEANVIKKCGGLPLAAKVLGGLLRGLGCEEWDEILRSNLWDEKGEVLPVLRLSYYYLPSNLKRCFVFCCMVPKNFYFEREKLVLLWMAENLLQDFKGNKKRIHVGYEYLCELESRSLIQPAIEKGIHGDLYFSMHDLVIDLAKSVSEEFYKSFDLGNSFSVGEKTRHFSYVVTSDNYENPIRFKGVNEVNRLRTFLPLIRRWNLDVMLPPLLCSKIWPQLNVLRSLTLAKACIQNLPDSIGSLKLLRYLDLSYNKELKQLPDSLASLYNLEVLNLSGCSSLTKLPSKMTQLNKLNYLNIRGSESLHEMPLEMGRLKDLEVLTDFVLGKGSGSSIGELKGLKDLWGELRIHGLQNITNPEDALVANLKGKSNLEELWLDWYMASQGYIGLDWNIDHGISEDATIILENLRPHAKLKKLSIHNYSGTRLPDWSGQLPSLKTLEIWKCQSLRKLVPAEIPAGHFSALVYLDIHNCPNLELPQHHCFTSIEKLRLHLSCDSLQFFPLSSFPMLKELSLEGLQSIESLGAIDESTNLNLGTLTIYGCKKLIANCSSWGLRRLLSLSHLEIDSFDLESFPEEGMLPSSLSTLRIYNVPNLRSLNGKSFQLLTSLEKLELWKCPKLQRLPEEGLPTSLSTLRIWGPPLLKSRCQKEQGEDWSKIAHIPNIDIWD